MYFIQHINPIFVEKVVYSPKLKLHGVIDCIGYYNGVLSIIDFKFSSKPKDEQYITAYRRQVAAYALIIYKELGILIEQCVIAVGNEYDNECQIFTYKTNVLVTALLNNLKSIDYFTKKG